LNFIVEFCNVFQECLTTVPPEPEAVRCLLEYGLQETDCDVISSDGDDRARFISEKVILFSLFSLFLIPNIFAFKF